MIRVKKSEYETACESISHIIPSLLSVSDEVRRTATEIRLKVGQAVIIRCCTGNFTIQTLITPEMAEECIAAFCRYSVHNYENDLANGFITLNGGHRAGFCGKAVYTESKISFIKNISSINIRIAREHIGIADCLSDLFYNYDIPKGLLIIGKPLSGKTTILRDLCRNIGEKYRLSIIDERCEIAASYNGEPQLMTGRLSDVFTGFSKNDGMIRAIRTMSPQYVVLDELGFDYSLVSHCINSGAGIIMTAHADGINDLQRNEALRKLLDTGAISHIAVLSSFYPGNVEQVIKTEELRFKAGACYA